MDSPAKFLRLYALGSIIVALILVSINFAIDLYGLFWRDGKSGISIYSDERTSKYLLAHRYVPNNFNVYLLGPSLSANINTKEFSDYRIYNLSMMGANITEQYAVLAKALEVNNPSKVIICLHPYLTADHGMKTAMINEKEYWAALGSVSLFKAYGLSIVRKFNLMPGKYPTNQFNDFGYNNYNDLLRTDVKAKIESELQKPDAINAIIDLQALQEFDLMVADLKRRGVKIIGYFHPLPYEIFNKFEPDMLKYQLTIRQHLGDSTLLLDFNNSEYQFFTKDYSNYIDHGHLSEKGQRFLLQEIIAKSGL
ncbi:MAG: hypothetical protein KF763_10835 [Cyclobacteriaceae bacterium]|nr:hypothetical protein [Cyclobacteriaceae bacterium]